MPKLNDGESQPEPELDFLEKVVAEMSPADQEKWRSMTTLEFLLDKIEDPDARSQFLEEVSRSSSRALYRTGAGSMNIKGLFDEQADATKSDAELLKAALRRAADACTEANTLLAKMKCRDWSEEEDKARLMGAFSAVIGSGLHLRDT